MSDLYSQEDVQQILHLAIARQTDTGELTRTQLMEIANELGISPLDLQMAEQEWLARRDETQDRQTFNLYRRAKIKQDIVKYLIVNVFMLVINLLTSGGITWSMYIILVWGMFLALTTWKLLQTIGDDYDRAFQRWRHRRWMARSVKTIWNRWIRQ